MKIIKTYDKAGTILIDSKPLHIRKINTQLNAPLGNIKGIVLHWSGCPRNIVFDDYHINIAEIEKEPVIAQTLKLSAKGQHLWGRNTNLLGISISCMDEPTDFPSDSQINYTSILVAEICAWKQLDPNGKIILSKKKVSGSNLIDVYNAKGELELIEVPVISDHATFSKLDGYYPDRWDIGKYLSVIQKQAKGIYKELKAGKRQFLFKDIIS